MTGAELKRLRRSLGLTQAQAAEALEYSRQQVVKLESGKHAIRRPESVQRALVEYMRKGKTMTRDQKRRVWMQNYGGEHIEEAIGECMAFDVDMIVTHMHDASETDNRVERDALDKRVGQLMREKILPYLDGVYDEVAGKD